MVCSQMFSIWTNHFANHHTAAASLVLTVNAFNNIYYSFVILNDIVYESVILLCSYCPLIDLWLICSISSSYILKLYYYCIYCVHVHVPVILWSAFIDLIYWCCECSIIINALWFCDFAFIIIRDVWMCIYYNSCFVISWFCIYYTFCVSEFMWYMLFL